MLSGSGALRMNPIKFDIQTISDVSLDCGCSLLGPHQDVNIVPLLDIYFILGGL